MVENLQIYKDASELIKRVFTKPSKYGTINGISFNGSANIDVNPTSGAFSNGQGAKTIQSGGTASGGSSGDIFYIY